MSSFPKHSYEQAYDHAFPPSPPQLHQYISVFPTVSERTPLITKAPTTPTGPTATSSSNNNNNSSNSNSSKPQLLPSFVTPGPLTPSTATALVTDTDALLGYEIEYQQQQQQQQHQQYPITNDGYPTSLSARETALKELRILLRYSGPVVLTYILQNSLQLASLVSLGHLGSIELAASSLASMFASVTCWSVSLGTATALDTLCSQSFTSHHPHTLGLHLQRAILILMLLLIPIAGVWLSSEQIFLLLGQEPALAQHAAIFMRGLLPGAPAYLIFECVKKFLQAQGNMHASTLVLLIASPINVILNYALVWNKYIGIGYIGAPIATSISYWNMLILLLLYVRFVDGYQGWGGWTRDSLTGWPAFMKLAIPGILMVCTEWWAFEVLSLAASFLGTIALAAQSVVVQTSGLLYTIPFGISIAASNRVGNLIGMGDHRSAQISSHVSIVLAVLFGVINSLVLLTFKDHWGRLFSEDADVVSTVAMVLPFVALFQISDGVAGVGGGVLRGVGLQHLGAYLNLIAYYLVAFPIGFVMAFKLGWGLRGLWGSLCIALSLVSLGELWVIIRTNWPSEVRKCKIRNDQLVKRRESLQAEIEATMPTH
ncbi:hypothetical protein BX616_001262 [Lobosporangium transversale]|uniref:Mate-domain-containing protein n=1 Tax=Lobosporangium transversale TaxID=64571 RepID=A0A1Y2GUX5_9FUNG|nr:mate-domain-containing protein [Lobosporangium transversale]KAF9917360.1 hypothetical protein BX616_001262 [Lobosporangium transversale]ORZ24851.1 mate-domain-containing protein [Lobosporangium transversale]|eukprot:XP_021883832.1 mate-domain-containing protein [Lobosporangium transversale]